VGNRPNAPIAPPLVAALVLIIVLLSIYSLGTLPFINAAAINADTAML